jgi:hypothetical protein
MQPALKERYAVLDARLRAWPRTPANDPFHAASLDLAARLARGGEHAGRDIPEAFGRTRAAHPGVEFVYAWPFEDAEVVRLPGERVRRAAG